MFRTFAAAATLACTPHAGLGSVTFVRGATQHVLDLETCREQVRPAPKPRPGRIASPDGLQTATVRYVGGTQSIVAGGRSLLSLPRWSPNAQMSLPAAVAGAAAISAHSKVRWTSRDRHPYRINRVLRVAVR